MARISNSNSNSLVVGTAEDDYIYNSSDGINVTIDANAGNDDIDNEATSVTINAGTGNDSVYNSGSNVTIDGNTGIDTIRSAGDNVSIDGGIGDDSIYSFGHTSNVTINAGEGNDSIAHYYGDSAIINGGAGNDSILNDGTNVTIDGGDGDDSIKSGSGLVTINGGNGNDTIYVSTDGGKIDSGDGDDYIYDEYGDSLTIFGGAGNDTIRNELGCYDTINGGAGNDLISLNSAAWNNSIQYTEGGGHDTVWGYSAGNNIYAGERAHSLQINSSVGWSSVVSGNNIVITVGDGSITLVDAATTPADTSTATTPADTSTATTPADTSTATTPADTSTATTPADTSTATTPADTSTATTPADTSTATTPAVEPTPVTPVNPAAPTDVVFIIDNTSSMDDEIANVKTAIISFAKNLANSGAGYRLGLVEFGDLNESNIKVYGFTDRDTFISWIDSIKTDGGGDGPESGLEAITVATTMDFMPGSNKRFIVVSDADFHNLGESGNGDPSTYLQTEAVQALLNANAVKMDVVGTPESNCQTEWEPLANATGGKFYDINKLAGGEVLEEIADDILGRAHVNINLDIDSVPEGTTSGVFVVTPTLNAAGAVVPASSDATFKTAAEEGDYVVGYVIANKAYMADPNSPWRQIVTIPDNWIVSGTYQDDALNVTGSNAVISGSLGKDNISINEDAVNTTLVDVSELQNGSDTLSFSKRVTPGTLQQNFTGGGTALYTTDSDGELDFVINLQGIAALDESLLNCEVSNAGKPNTIRELIYGEVADTVIPDVTPPQPPIVNDTLEGRIMFAQWGYGFTPPEGNPLFVDPTLATSADLAVDFGSPSLDEIAPVNFAVTQDDFTAQDFNAEFSVKQAYKLSAASKANFC